MVPRRTRCSSVIGIFLGIFGLVFGILWETVFYRFVEKVITLQPNSLIYDLWHAPPVNVGLDIYLFNWTNPEDFRNTSIKPIFQELGPYSYNEVQEKVGIVWHAHNASVSYQKKSVYRFDAERSRGNLDDRIITINSLAVTASTLAKQFSPTKRSLTEFAMLIYPRDLTLRKTADELLFKGFDDPLLSVVNALPMTGFNLPFDRFGYCYGRNGSSDFLGNFNVHTGANDVSQIGQMHTWKYQTHTNYPNKCSKVRGSASEFQGPQMKKNKTINIFAPEFCRDVPLDYDGEDKVDGVKGFRFVGGLQGMDNGSLYPENECYCNGECMPSGVINISSCWYNSPFFASYPHFYKADPYYLNQLEGLNPQKEKHEFVYIIEPRTSIGMSVFARTQMNQLVQTIPNSRMFRDVRKIMFPMFWAEERSTLPPKILDYFRIIEKVILFGQLFGGFCCILGFVMALRHPIVQHFKKKFVHQLENEDFKRVMDTGKDITGESIIIDEASLFIQTSEKMKSDDSSDSPNDSYSRTLLGC